MRAVIQRVHNASVEVDGTIVGRIDAGLLVYLGIQPDDADKDVTYMVEKIGHLRIFSDVNGLMNLDVQQAHGAALIISAFTTMADARKGRRPSFTAAAQGWSAEPLYNRVCDTLSDVGIHVERGRFGAMMSVKSINDGPVCILLDSRRGF